MDSLLLDAVSALGELESSPKASDVILRLGAQERFDDPPFRHYLIASQNGVSLLFENDRLLDVQVSVEASKTEAPCPLVLPFGLMRGMHQADVHRTLGQPTSSDDIDSCYDLDAYAARLVAVYNSDGLLRYLSFGRPLATV